MISHLPGLEPLPAPAKLCSNLAQGIHAAAQPLTVLLASLSKSQTDAMSNEELRELTASSAVEVQRVCTLFSCLQQLVMAECIKPQLTATATLPLLTYVADGVQGMFQENGVPFDLVLPESCPPVLINWPRTTQAFSRVLLVIHALSAPPQRVELSASSSPDAVNIVVRNSLLSLTFMNPETSLSLAVAEASIRSQHAGFVLTLQPFTVRIDLPKAAAS